MLSSYKPYFVSPNLYFQNRPPSSSNLSLTQISHSFALSRFFFRAIAISKFLKANLSASVWLQSRSFSERLRFRSSILSIAVYNVRKTNRILQNLLKLRDLSQNDISAISILISKLSLSLDFEDQGIAYEEIKALREGGRYDLDLFNIVAVPDFNMVAMENKSLNIFNSKLVLASPETATDADYTAILGVIGHERDMSRSGPLKC